MIFTPGFPVHSNLFQTRLRDFSNSTAQFPGRSGCRSVRCSGNPGDKLQTNTRRLHVISITREDTDLPRLFAAKLVSENYA